MSAATGPSGSQESPGSRPSLDDRSLRYTAAGVSLAAGADAVRRIAPAVRSTYGPEVMAGIGGFAGLFALPTGRWRQPVLAASTDSVGTKVAIAHRTRRYDTIGIDLVAMCVDDVACAGAEPLFLLDCYTTGHLEPAVVAEVVVGVAEGCRQAGCALIGGEMAEHPLPGASEPDAFDLVGFAVGVVNKANVLGADRVQAGDALVGLHSPGLRSNGYSLARRVLLEEAGRPLDGPAWDGAGHTLADELLRPSVIYAPAVVAMARELPVRAAAHITGGGIPGNLSRVLHADYDAIVTESSWRVPRIFSEIESVGGIPHEEMAEVFNLGVGMVVVADREAAGDAVEFARSHGHGASVIGEVVAGSGRVRLEGEATRTGQPGPG